MRKAPMNVLFFLLTSRGSKLFLSLMMAAFLVSLTACSEAMNINQILVSNKQRNSLVSLLERAQLAYDRRDFSAALKIVQQAEEISPLNEDVAVLSGYIHLALTGLDSFAIARAMISANSTKSASTTTLVATNSTDQVSSIFAALLAKMEIFDEDLQTLGEYSDDNDLSAFKDYPIIIPKTANEARASDLSVFSHISAAISKICPFIAAEAKLSDYDQRHNSENCVPTEVLIKKKASAHFLWAFVHLVEASIFYSVVQYHDSLNTQANIKSRADALEAKKTSFSISEYVSHISALANDVTSVYAFDDTGSQFNAIVYNLTAVSLAFAQIGSVPAKVKKSLDSAVAAINDTKNAAGSNVDQQKGNSLKSQLNEKMASQVSDRIKSLAKSNPTEFNENKTELCDSYSTISGSTTVLDECK